jgi:hypothetical protein
MKHRLVLGLLAALALATMATPARAVDDDAIKRAVDRGVKALRDIQRPDGTWPHGHVGATALAGLTLLECGATADDDAVRRAADVIRNATVNNLTHNYSVSLSILFLDRLGDPEDVPLIESLMVRLMAGQSPTDGGWSYGLPQISDEEVRRLDGVVKGRKKSASRREAGKPDSKRKVDDLAPEIKDQLRKLARGEMIADQGGVVAQPIPGQAGFMPYTPGMTSDNSNTQFATLALWVGRRHGLPVETAITRLDRRFRNSQLEDGGWQYVRANPPPGMPEHMRAAALRAMGSTAAMTCAGVLALAIADGATLEYLREHKPDAKAPDISQDKNLNRGLEALGAVIENPKGLKPERGYHPQAPEPDRVGGKTYYFLWSLERVAVALDLKTIGKKDWYGWGSEILLENQLPDGTWAGDHGEGGVDTCFALLFLKRANLARDLTAHIKGKITDPGERMLRGGVGVGKTGIKKMKSGIETLKAKPIDKAPKVTDAQSLKLADALLKASPNRQLEMLERMESKKGVEYTEALATAIPKLDGASHRRAREALENRLTRMKDETLAEYLQDDDTEIRRAAALAVAQKESKALVPNLIGLLRDSETSVVRAAHASLKALTSQDFGPKAKATREEHDQAVLKWIEWWSKQRKKSAKE